MRKISIFVSMVAVLIAFQQLFAQAIIWSEDFTYPDGTIQGSGTPPKWTVDVSACSFSGDDHFEVRSNQMEGNNLDGEAVWTSQNIDISTYANVSVTVNLSEVGDLEGTDYIRVYYKIDGGAETLFDVNGDNSDDFDALVALQTNLSGNTLTIVIRVKNNAATEFIQFDDVIVREGLQTLDHFAIDPISDQIVGAPFPITVTAKDASDATVTSFTGTVEISDLSGTINPTISGNFIAGTWTGNVTINSQYTNDQITVTKTGGTESGTSNQFDVVTGAGPGSVVINELMWTGSTLSSADEWIELRNTTSNAIDLSGWQLTKLSSGSETFMLEIPAGSTIPANGYFLISNYDEANSQIAVTPDVVNTAVSLANSKLQIKLYNGQWDGGATLIDVADDGVGAPAAGDNTNKYSMMRTDPPGDGTLAANWFTANFAAGWDAGATEKGTPGTANFIADPEIDVQRPAGTSIVDGGTDDVGNQNIGSLSLTYTIDNSAGTAQLNVIGVIASNLTNCSNFSVLTSLPLNIAAGNTATLQISFDVDAAGTFSFDMDIANNDDDENPYDIQVTGNGNQPTNIVLSAFSAEPAENGILIQWTTETEPNNAGFNIFRSQNESSDYLKINENLIPARGNAMSGASYSYLNMLHEAGNYYYKLQSVSLTGDTSFYGPVSVVLTEVALRKMAIPKAFSLSQNYPNPFNPQTSIEYSLPEPANVELTIYNLSGNLVRKLVSGHQNAGLHSAIWDGRDDKGNKVVSGVYFYHFQAIGKNKVFRQTNKMILMK